MSERSGPFWDAIEDLAVAASSVGQVLDGYRRFVREFAGRPPD